MKKECSILLVDDHPVFRQGLLSLLEKEKDLKVVGEASDGEIAIDLVRKLSPDVVVMEITMPNLDGIDVTRQIVSEFPETKVVALSAHSEKRFVRGMLQAGAVGYILKKSAPKEMIEGIRTVWAGNVYLSRSISGLVVSDYSKLLPEAEGTAGILPEPILRTKLHPPPVTEDIIPRARLVEQLEKGRERGMTLISAPAGYGKSIAASQWLSTCPCPGAWVSIDESDSDLREFLKYVIAAIQNAFPQGNLKTKSLLQTTDLPSVKILARFLLNDLERMEEPLLLVLDDFYRIKEEAVHNLLTELLHHPSPNLHLALLTRRDPPLPLSDLRAYGQLTEIGVKDLRFTDAETNAFLERFLHVTIDEKTASVLEEKIEGWVTGLRLVALSLGHKDGPESLLSGLKENRDFVQDYLIKQVLLSAPEYLARHMMETSILNRFCAPLCDALHAAGKEQQAFEKGLTGAAFIDWLEENRLFVIPLDNTRTWFRYHHLFQQLLKTQLTKDLNSEEINALNQHASLWFEGHGLIDEAIQHALMANDIHSAVRLVEENCYKLMNTEQWHSLASWLRMFSDEIIEKKPILLTAKGFYNEYRSMWPELYATLGKLETLLPNISAQPPDLKRIIGEYNTLKAEAYYLKADPGNAMACAKKALDMLPVEAQYIKTSALYWYAFSLHMTGNMEKAVKKIAYAMNSPDEFDHTTHTRLLMALCSIYFMEGDLESLKKTALSSLELGEKYDLQGTINHSHYFLGSLHYLRNEFEEAKDSIEAIYTNDRYVSRVLYTSLCSFIQSLIDSAEGCYAKAWKNIESINEFAQEMNNTDAREIIRAFSVDLALTQGNNKLADELNLDIDFDLYPPAWLFHHRQLTEVKVLMAKDSKSGNEKAARRLCDLIEYGRSIHNNNFLIHALAVQSLLFWKRNEKEAAYKSLTESLKLGKRGAYIRPYVDLGPILAEILKMLLKQNVAEDYIHQILTAFEGEQRAAAQSDSPSVEGHSPTLDRSALFESLTQRELEVLTHVAEGLSNKDIASELFLSSETVKKHLYNIFQKLNVHSRTGALNKAKELGILSQE